MRTTSVKSEELVSGITKEILEAYRSTTYVVDGGRVAMRIDEYSDSLARTCADFGVRTAAFITAWNPFSRPLGIADNRALNASLESDIRSRNLQFLDGEGVAGDGSDWKEASFLVLGITRDEAYALGVAYQQNAIVFAGEDAVPRLVLTQVGIHSSPGK